MRSICARHSRLAKREQDFALRRAFEDLMQSYICQPQIAFMIHRESVRHHKSVLTPSGEQLSRSAVDHADRRCRNAILGERIRPLSSSAMENKDAVLRVDTNPGTEPEDVAVGQLWPIGYDFVMILRGCGQCEYQAEWQQNPK